ncbi:MAG TPA: hypothetical protein VFM88_00175 [Vicinamibacteria bacterium]|nr:hypothetical protein [Vicinamibacteria bacterium]
MKMKLNFNFILIATLAAVLVHPGLLLAQERESLDELRREVAQLRAEIERQRAVGQSKERLDELERRIDLLAAELEESRTGGAVEVDPKQAGVYGFAPAASKVYRAAKGVSIGGYGEAVYENYSDARQDGAASGRTDQFDFVRQIVYVGYKFDDEILFNSEIEFEHASTGKGGEVSVEFAYVDWKPAKRLGLRAGMVLVPVGFLNELHEPPIFHGAKRPDVESAILPSTWRENGAGLYGDVGPVQWRAYLVSGLASTGLSASGIRGARQSGARSKSEDFGVTGRLDFTGVEGLLVGASFFTGDSAQGATVDGQGFDADVSLFDVHAQYERGGLQLRALFAKGSVDDVAILNRANGLTGDKSVGENQYGWYVQGAFDVMTLAGGSRWSVAPFARYEELDTQDGVPAGFTDDPATERSVLTLGVGVKPLANVVFKADYQRHRNQASTGVSQWNLAVGYLF